MGPILALVNLAARNAKAVLEELRADARLGVEIVAPRHIAHAITDHVARGAERIIVAGGDGTISTAAAALVGQPAALAVVPAGTLNHFAHGLAIPMATKAAVEVALKGVPVQVDVGQVNERVFLNTSAVGVYATLVRLRRRLERWLGYHGASAIAAMRTFCHLHSFTVELTVHGEVHHSESPLVFVGVGERELRLPRLGMRKTLGQRGLHVLIVRPTTRLDLLMMALRTLVGGTRLREGAREEVESLAVSECRITLPRRRGSVTLDGEVVRLPGPLHYSYRPHALTVVVPRTSLDSDLNAGRH